MDPGFQPVYRIAGCIIPDPVPCDDPDWVATDPFVLSRYQVRSEVLPCMQRKEFGTVIMLDHRLYNRGKMFDPASQQWIAVKSNPNSSGKRGVGLVKEQWINPATGSLYFIGEIRFDPNEHVANKDFINGRYIACSLSHSCDRMTRKFHDVLELTLTPKPHKSRSGALLYRGTDFERYKRKTGFYTQAPPQVPMADQKETGSAADATPPPPPPPASATQPPREDDATTAAEDDSMQCDGDDGALAFLSRTDVPPELVKLVKSLDPRQIASAVQTCIESLNTQRENDLALIQRSRANWEQCRERDPDLFKMPFPLAIVSASLEGKSPTPADANKIRAELDAMSRNQEAYLAAGKAEAPKHVSQSSRAAPSGRPPPPPPAAAASSQVTPAKSQKTPQAAAAKSTPPAHSLARYVRSQGWTAASLSDPAGEGGDEDDGAEEDAPPAPPPPPQAKRMRTGGAGPLSVSKKGMVAQIVSASADFDDGDDQESKPLPPRKAVPKYNAALAGMLNGMLQSRKLVREEKIEV